jgi:hypothetical protein
MVGEAVAPWRCSAGGSGVVSFLDGIELAPESEPNVILRRTVAGRVIDLTELLFGRYALNVGPAGSQDYESQYIYESRRGSSFTEAEAIVQMASWDGVREPRGWLRAVRNGRPTPRRPGGDPAREEKRE